MPINKNDFLRLQRFAETLKEVSENYNNQVEMYKEMGLCEKQANREGKREAYLVAAQDLEDILDDIGMIPD